MSERLSKTAKPSWDAVEKYVRARAAERGDTYGWSRDTSAPKLTAVILVAEAAPIDSFPTIIGDVRILLRHIPAPDLR